MVASDTLLIQKWASIRAFWELHATCQQTDEPYWLVLEDEAFAEFKAGEFILVFKPTDWYPYEADSLTHWLENFVWGDKRFV